MRMKEPKTLYITVHERNKVEYSLSENLTLDDFKII